MLTIRVVHQTNPIEPKKTRNSFSFLQDYWGVIVSVAAGYWILYIFHRNQWKVVTRLIFFCNKSITIVPTREVSGCGSCRTAGGCGSLQAAGDCSDVTQVECLGLCFVINQHIFMYRAPPCHLATDCKSANIVPSRSSCILRGPCLLH